MIHELKTWPAFYQAIEDGRKTFEFRINDRGFQVGDVLHLREWDPDKFACNYTRREMKVEVTYVLPTELTRGMCQWVIMAIRPIPKEG